MGAAALIVLTIVLVVGARSSGVGAARIQTAPEAFARDLRFEDRPDGSVVVIDARNGEQVDRLAAGQDNFIRGALRSLVRDGRQVSASTGRAFRLSVRTDGRFILEDTHTGRLINLEAFGSTNASAFARLLDAPFTASATQQAQSRN